jgi:GTPase SAR1 family protein
MNQKVTEEPNPTELVEHFIHRSNKSVFLTGKAGTGKTTLLKKLIRDSYKQTAVVAPTGIAALNADGVTIHSFFQLPFGGFIPDFQVNNLFSQDSRFESKDTLMRNSKMNKKRRQLLRNLELLVIDEVSMLRADLLDAIDWVLRNVRKINSPFGGVQVLFIGDLLQLPPVTKPEEWSILSKYYPSMFFFNARVLQEFPPFYIELKHIYRQEDSAFIAILNELRNNAISDSSVLQLNKYVKSQTEIDELEGYITLTTHNSKADTINRQMLEKIDAKLFEFSADINNDFPKSIFPLEEVLQLKEGAQIMFIKNDSSMDKLFYNGKMGVIARLNKHEIFVRFEGEKKLIEVEKVEWENIRYTVNNSGEIEEEVIGTFFHYPIKLAWAITVHKSQGLTFDRAILDVGSVFAPGQAYVAFSRLRSLQGLVLTKSLKLTGLSNDAAVMNFINFHQEHETNLPNQLQWASRHYFIDLLTISFDFDSLYSSWAQHHATYANVTTKSEKGKNKSWIHLIMQQLDVVQSTAPKLRRQLGSILSQLDLDESHLNDRVQAAYAYFFKILDGLVYSSLKKMEELSRSAKNKLYVEELEDLEELSVETVLKIKKARIIIEAFFLGKKVSKDTVYCEEVKNYHLAILALIKQEKRSVTQSLYDEPTVVVSVKTDKLSKKVKKSSKSITLDLLREGNNLDDIVRKRELSRKSVYQHFLHLLKEEEVEIEDLLPGEKIKAIASLICDHPNLPMYTLFQDYGEGFEFEEFKLYNVSLIR